jgi:type I restriction enzyme S subunit
VNKLLGIVPPEWNICCVGSLGEVVTGQTPSTSQPAYFGGNIPFVSPADINGQRYISQTQTTLTDEGAKRVRVLPANAILVTCIGGLGKVGQAKTSLATNQQINSIIPNDKLDPAYGFWAAHLLRSQLDAMAGLQVLPIVNKRLFSQLLLPCPPLSEQCAIAHILDTLETQIQQTQKLIAKLKRVKAGLLDDLLTNGIDENGEVRDPVAHPEKFKLQYPPTDRGNEENRTPLPTSSSHRACPNGLAPGRIPREWNIDYLIHHISLPGGQINPKKPPYCNWTLIAPDHIEPATGRLLNVQTASQQNATSGKYCFQPYDVLYSKIRPHLRKAVLAHDDGLCSADMYPLRPRSTITPRFLLSTVLSERFSKFAIAVSARSRFPKMNRKELAEYIFALPSYEEQIHISKLLEAQDTRIISEEAHLNKLQQIKQGLMYDLLTGQVRVTQEAD